MEVAKLVIARLLQPSTDSSSDQEFLAKNGIERTKNGTGFQYSYLGESVQLWIGSLPHSKNPLLDLGAAYGVQTIHAIKSGRDVVALDADPTHIQVLRQRVQALSAEGGPDTKRGKLVNALAVTLPASHACGDASVSGVLLSEVLHFMKPGEPLAVFKDAFRWLEPGGLLVSTSGSALNYEFILHIPDFEFLDRRTAEDIAALQSGTDEELVESAPTYARLKADSKYRDTYCGNVYLMTTQEVGGLARLSGFEILRLEYTSPRKYPDMPDSLTNETVLLVARKPLTSELQLE